MSYHLAKAFDLCLPSFHVSILLRIRNDLAIFQFLIRAGHPIPIHLCILCHPNEQTCRIHVLHRFPTNLHIFPRFHMLIYLFHLPCRFSNIPHTSIHHPKLIHLFHAFHHFHSTHLYNMNLTQDGQYLFELTKSESLLFDRIKILRYSWSHFLN